ncbi:MAG: hypothetical protein JSR72_23700 [Proteobacteria bacterium]|nr:hypothetical protein [Pseudomonadota bacterium]
MDIDGREVESLHGFPWDNVTVDVIILPGKNIARASLFLKSKEFEEKRVVHDYFFVRRTMPNFRSIFDRFIAYTVDLELNFELDNVERQTKSA